VGQGAGGPRTPRWKMLATPPLRRSPKPSTPSSTRLASTTRPTMLHMRSERPCAAARARSHGQACRAVPWPARQVGERAPGAAWSARKWLSAGGMFRERCHGLWCEYMRGASAECGHSLRAQPRHPQRAANYARAMWLGQHAGEAADAQRGVPASLTRQIAPATAATRPNCSGRTSGCSPRAPRPWQILERCQPRTPRCTCALTRAGDGVELASLLGLWRSQVLACKAVVPRPRRAAQTSWL